MKEKKIFKRFQDVSTFIKYLETGKTQPVFERKTYSDDNDYSFTRTKNYEDANKRLKFGDRELQKKIDEAGLATERTKIYRTQLRRQLQSGVVGCAPIVPAYIAGAPNCMASYKQIKVRQKVINIGFNCAVSGGANEDTIIQNGSHLLSALMSIEARGTRVNLWAINLDVVSNCYVSFAIKIKEASQPFDVLKMSYPIAHPSMNRRHKFRFTEVTPDVPKGFVGGYGCPVRNDKRCREYFTEQGLKLDAVFNFESLEGKSSEDIVKIIMSGGE